MIKVREVVKNKTRLFTVRLTVRVDPPSAPLTVSKKIKTSDYECIWPETNFGKFFTIFDHFGLGID